MFAVAAQLSHELNRRVERLWDSTELISPHQIPRVGRVPHLSFQMVETPNPHALEVLLQEPLTPVPVQIRTSALGVFARPRQVLFLNVVRDPALERYYQAINLRLMAQGYNLHPFYGPAVWTPHITLALGPFLPADLCELLRIGAHHDLVGEWELGPICLLGPAQPVEPQQPSVP